MCRKYIEFVFQAPNAKKNVFGWGSAPNSAAGLWRSRDP